MGETLSESLLVRAAVLGDLHGAFDGDDVRWLDEQGYDAVLVVGDLGHMRWRSALPLAAELARLQTPTFWIPGNHDGASLHQVAAEALGPVALADRLAVGMATRVAALESAMGDVIRVGYSRHVLGRGVHLIGGRPHSMGGPSLAFRSYITDAFGICDLEASGARLKELVAEVPRDEPIIFLAHNGPAGLGESRNSMFGRDFHRDEGDWGDPDLRTAVDAASTGPRPVAVVAGHMHRRLRGGGRRLFFGREGGTCFVNAARVPRIRRDGSRFHIELRVYADRIEADELTVRDGAVQVTRCC